MKVKVLNRSEAEYKGSNGSVTRYYRNPDPQLHPFERAREYTRALVATKMERIFAKPFITALDGHTDAVKCLVTTRFAGAPLVSGDCDGELRIWDLSRFGCVGLVPHAHRGFVRGVVTSLNDRHIFTCGDDKTIKGWDLKKILLRDEDLQGRKDDVPLEPLQTFHSPAIPTSIDHHWQKPLIVTTGETVDIWDHNRSSPLHSFEWGCDRVFSSKFNPAESCLLGSTAADNSIGLYDLRASAPIRKVVLKMRSNALSWNPREPLNFTVANEDCSCYTFDMRKLKYALFQHRDFVMAVLDIKFSPTGEEFVAAGYDKTVRIFKRDGIRSREVYHTKRMQRVLCCSFSADSRFILTGSEDCNIRVWKAKADMKLGTLTDREKRATAHREALKKKFQHLPEIKRIARHRHVPKMILNLTTKRRIMKDAKKRKESNRRAHSKPGTVPFVPVTTKQFVREEE